VVQDHGATVIYDADRGLGHLAAARAMELAISRARELGIATVSIRNNGHCGALAYYTQQAAGAGCIGFAATTGGILMAPWGGRERRIGLNPIAWSAPTPRGWAFNLDMAPSVVAGSKLHMAIERGEKIPLGWALDSDGRPTDDPSAAFQGVLLPIGGPKGIGLATAADILCGVLSGSRYGEAGTGGSGQLVQAIDITYFQPLEEFLARMERMIAYVKSSAPAPGAEGIFLPGELEHQRRQERLRQGIPLDRPTRSALREEAVRAGLAYDLDC
jgi:LDH2 family malate/lactate/ureidoglycolate dehydrogenase